MSNCDSRVSPHLARHERSYGRVDARRLGLDAFCRKLLLKRLLDSAKLLILGEGRVETMPFDPGGDRRCLFNIVCRCQPHHPHGTS